ncbi:MAG: GNAT family N-acetyltransferase [Anaerolineae bacterium]
MRDIRESREATESHRDEVREKGRLSEAGRRALQGRDTYRPRPDDTNFTDAQGKPITIRTFGSGDQKYIRAYDRDRQPPPERLDRGQAGRANVHLERDLHTDQITRARLQDIETDPAYRESGIGSAMLSVAEQQAQQAGAREMYGSFDPTQKERGKLRDFYTKRGYHLRPTSGGGVEIHKRLREET